MSVAEYERLPVPHGAIEHPWRRDIDTGVAAMTTTGGHLWNAAERLADYMEAEAGQVGLDRPGIAILELGSGVGWLGMCMAANLHQARSVTCTEQAAGGAVSWLQQNICRNSHLDLSKLRCCACDWSWFDTQGATHGAPKKSPAQAPSPAMNCSAASHPEPLSAGSLQAALPSSSAELGGTASVGPSRRQRWDFIVGSDLVYNEEGCRLLPKVFAQLTGPQTVILYAHTKRRFEMLDCDFFNNLNSEGLTVEEVRERWVPDAPPSPPPFSSLFPDMRIAVYRIMQRNRPLS